MTVTDAALGKFYRAAGIGKLSPSEELTALLAKRAPDPAIFEERPPYYVRAQISNNRPDTYFTRMCGAAGCPATPTLANCTLGNFAADSASDKGVSVLPGHDSTKLGLGRSLTGTITGTQGAAGGGVVKVHSDYYIVPGLSLSGVSSDEVIDGIRAGIVSDVSVGFYLGEGGSIRCTLCNRSIFSWECWHIPGVFYAKNEKQEWVRAEPDAAGAKVAIAWIHGARLSEYSLVYSGATPEAQITDLKARQEAEGGRVTPKLALELDQRFRIKLPHAGRRFSGFGESDPEVTDDSDPSAEEEDHTTDPEEATDMDPTAITEALRSAGITQTDDPVAGIRSLAARMDPVREALRELGAANADPAAELRRLSAANKELTPLAEDGRRYREVVVKEALAEGIRAFGQDKFDSARWTEKFGDRDKWSVLDVEEQRDSWRATADAQLKGGRQSVEDAADAPPKPERPAVNPAAYGLRDRAAIATR